MKLVITTDTFLPRLDGISRFLSLLLPHLNGIDVTIVCPNFGPISIPKTKIVQFPLIKIRYGDIYFNRPNRKFMDETIRDADLVFNQTVGPIGIMAIRSARRLHKPLVHFVHCIDWEFAANAIRNGKHLMRFGMKLLDRYLLNRTSLLLVPSREVERTLRHNHITTKAKIVPLGVTDRFIPPRSKTAAKKRIGLSDTDFVVGYCGRIAHEKDLPTLFSAFKQLKNAKLLIVGEGVSMRFPKGTIAVGKQEDVLPYLQAMDAFVLPSLTETSSFATMEAMAAGVPVVVTPVGREYIAHGKNGLLFAPHDASALTKHLIALADNKTLRDRLSTAGRKTISTRFRWEQTVKTIRTTLLHLQTDNRR